MEEGYPIAVEALDREAYLLAALFMASPPLQHWELHNTTLPGGGAMALAWARHTFEVSEASRRLISLAVMLRSVLDNSHRRPSGPVGKLVPDTSRPDEVVDLDLREACNKIIHARSVDLTPDSYGDRASLSQVIVLEGRHREADWRVDLEVLTFLGEAALRF